MGTHALYEVKVLMLLRNNKSQYLFMKNDHKDSIIYGYLNPPGGHIEPGESISETVIREVKEETGIEGVSNIKVRGVVNVVGFKDVPIIMLVISGIIVSDSEIKSFEEGTPMWVSRNSLRDEKILEDVEKILDIEEKTPSNEIFHVASGFENKKLISFEER